MNNQTCPYIVGSNEGTHYCSLSEWAIRERDKRIAELTAERDRLARASELILRVLDNDTNHVNVYLARRWLERQLVDFRASEREQEER